MKGNQPSLLLRYPTRSHTFWSQAGRWKTCRGSVQLISSSHFSPESILLVKSSTAHSASADWRATQPTPSRQNFMNCQFRSLFLHCRTPCSFEFKLDFWKRVHDLKSSLTSKKCRSKVSVTTDWENDFEEGLRFPLGRILLPLWLF